MPDEEQCDNLGAIYPVGEKQAEQIRARHGRPLADLTLDNLLPGRVTACDFGITGEGLRLQAEIAERAGRRNEAENRRRGSELVEVSDEVLLEICEGLRAPGHFSSPPSSRSAGLQGTKSSL